MSDEVERIRRDVGILLAEIDRLRAELHEARGRWNSREDEHAMLLKGARHQALEEAAQIAWDRSDVTGDTAWWIWQYIVTLIDKLD